MNLKFACSDQFEWAEEIARGIQGYLPNLIQNVDIVRTEAFVGISEVRDARSKVERIIKPDWERDVVFVVIQGSLYFADLELFELAGSTLNVLHMGSIAVPPSDRPWLGGLFLPQNMFKELRGDKDYWVKTGVEEILHCFGVPELHDEDCFFHPKAWGQVTAEDGRKDFCPKCRQLMLQLEDPLDFDQISARVEDIYRLTLHLRRDLVKRENLSREEQLMLGLHDLILSAFRRHFGDEMIIGVKLTPLAHECGVTVQVKQKTQPMEDLAQELEAEFLEEAGRHVTIFFEQPWKVTIANLIRKILSLRGFRTQPNLEGPHRHDE